MASFKQTYIITRQDKGHAGVQRCEMPFFSQHYMVRANNFSSWALEMRSVKGLDISEEKINVFSLQDHVKFMWFNVKFMWFNASKIISKTENVQILFECNQHDTFTENPYDHHFRGEAKVMVT